MVGWLTAGPLVGQTSSPFWRAQAPSSAAPVPNPSSPYTPWEPNFALTCAAASASLSQVQVLSLGIETPAFFNTSGLTAIEKLATPIGAPRSVPDTLPVSSTFGSMA